MTDVDRFFEAPPGPDGYIVVALKWPSLEEWDDLFVKHGIEGDDMPEQPEDWSGPAWTMDHIRRFHGWDDTAVQRYKVTASSLNSAHELEHEDWDKTGEHTMAILHTHWDAAQWVMAHSSNREMDDRRAMVQVWENLRDR